MPLERGDLVSTIAKSIVLCEYGGIRRALLFLCDLTLSSLLNHYHQTNHNLHLLSLCGSGEWGVGNTPQTIFWLPAYIRLWELGYYPTCKYALRAHITRFKALLVVNTGILWVE